MAIYVGRRRAGWAGLVVAGVCFILPAAPLVGLIAWAYVRLGKLPQAAGLLYGIKPVIMAVILQALWGLGRVAVKSRFLAVIGLAAVVLNCLGVNELVVLFGTGFLVAAGRAGPHGQRGIVSGLFPLLGFATGAPLVSAVGISGAAVAVPFSVGALFLFFVKVGSVLFGAAVTCCWRFCAPIWSSAGIGSVKASFWTRLPSAR